jgi:autotransporter-associated beta strand protein
MNSKNHSFVRSGLLAALVLWGTASGGWAQTVLIDFGSVATSNPDINGNHWNNYTNTGAVLFDLVSTGNTTNGYDLFFTTGVGMNTYSPQVIPTAALGLLAVSNAVIDGLNVNPAGGTNTFKINTLNTEQTYDFLIYGGRSAADTRSTLYTVTGGNSQSGTLTTSGTNLAAGNGGFSYNNNTVAELRGITPSGLSEIAVSYSCSTGTFAYLNAMLMLGYVPYTNGPVTLSAAKTYPGNTLIANGAAVDADVAGVFSAGASVLEIGPGGGSLTLNNVNQSIHSLAGSGDLVVNTGTNSLVLTGTASTFSSYYAQGTNMATTYAGVLSGSGKVNKTGSNHLTLSGANTFAGTFAVNVGTLTLGNANALQDAKLDTGGSGAQSVVFGVPGTNTYTMAGLAGFDAVDFGANTLQLNINAASTYLGVLSGSGSLVKAGTNTLTLFGTSTYTGPTLVSAGTLQVIGSIASSSVVTNNGFLVFNRNGAPETHPGEIAGSGTLIKTGTNTLTLTGTNTYTGTTFVLGGILEVNGSSIADGNNLTINGGVVAPTGVEVVSILFLGTNQVASGTWGATGSGAANTNDTHFAGSAGVVSVTGASASPFQTWQAVHFGSSTNASAAFNADPDSDGVSNLQEYAFGTDPNDGGSVVLPEVGAAGGYLTITVPRSTNATDVTYAVQGGSDLLAWTTLTNLTATSPAPAGSTVTFTNATPMDAAAAGFLRVKISLP